MFLHQGKTEIFSRVLLFPTALLSFPCYPLCTRQSPPETEGHCVWYVSRFGGKAPYLV